MSATVGRRREWFKILRDLSAVGIKYAEVARKCNRNPSTVADWADGGDPKEADARVVLSLYARHCPLKYLEHQREFEIQVAAADAAEASEVARAPSAGQPPRQED